jgi:hypothetical protein
MGHEVMGIMRRLTANAYNCVMGTLILDGEWGEWG